MCLKENFGGFQLVCVVFDCTWFMFIILHDSTGMFDLKVKKKNGNQFYGFQFEVPIHLLVTLSFYVLRGLTIKFANSSQ